MHASHRPRLLLILLLSSIAGSATALDHITLARDGKEIHVDGRLLVTAKDGGRLLLARDGVVWAVQPDELVKHTRDAIPFEPLTAEEMSQLMLSKLPRGFDVHRTAHYLIFYDTSRGYAQWCGSLFERLYMAFNNYWRRKQFDLHEPEFPLVAIVFAEKEAYLKFSKPELGDAGNSIIGYFNLATNRMTMYDLTGIEAYARTQRSGGSARQINQILARPEAMRQVSTIVHEATHQIAFNCGLHNRNSDCPVWFSEGVAVFFETPDLSSSRGWRGIGVTNRPRLVQFFRYLQERPPNSLATLIRDDSRFRDPKLALNAYAETWALTYYLIRFRSAQYIEYVKMLSEKPPLIVDGPAARLEQFENAFGDIRKLDVDFVRYMRRAR